MTAQERVRIIVEFGFTDRQAGFLELVMRHAGVCVPRQYARFAAIAHGGEKCNAFFDKLVRRGCAVRYDCLHNRARLYHVHHKPLYQAIGEGESRFRRPVPARRAVERLMLLDAVLASPDLRWLTTEAEKVSYLAEVTPPEAVDASPNSSADAGLARLARPFSSAFPIGIAASGQAVVFYRVNRGVEKACAPRCRRPCVIVSTALPAAFWRCSKYHLSSAIVVKGRSRLGSRWPVRPGKDGRLCRQNMCAARGGSST